MPWQSNRMQEKSILFDKVIPAILIVLAVFTAGLIVFAAGVLLGLVEF
jgi:predicted phage tail protein